MTDTHELYGEDDVVISRGGDMPARALGPAGLVTNRGDRDALAHDTVVSTTGEIRPGHRSGKRHEAAAEDVFPLLARPRLHERHTSNYRPKSKIRAENRPGISAKPGAHPD